MYCVKEYEYKKQAKNCLLDKKNANTVQYKSIAQKANDINDSSDYGNPSKIRMQRKMETPEAQEIYKLRSKTAELPFANMKQKHAHLTEFTTTGLKQVNTEFKLYAIGHNLKRIYNEIIMKK